VPNILSGCPLEEDVAQVEALARSIDPVRTVNNPVRLTHADLRDVLLEGTT
jgi:hypothetical protein